MLRMDFGENMSQTLLFLQLKQTWQCVCEKKSIPSAKHIVQLYSMHDIKSIKLKQHWNILLK